MSGRYATIFLLPLLSMWHFAPSFLTIVLILIIVFYLAFLIFCFAPTLLADAYPRSEHVPDVILAFFPSDFAQAFYRKRISLDSYMPHFHFSLPFFALSKLDDTYFDTVNSSYVFICPFLCYVYGVFCRAYYICREYYLVIFVIDIYIPVSLHSFPPAFQIFSSALGFSV